MHLIPSEAMIGRLSKPVYSKKRAATSQSVSQLASERDKRWPIKIIADLTEDNQIERAVWYLIGQSSRLDSNVRQRPAAMLRPGYRRRGDVYGLNLGADLPELLGKDTDRTTGFECSVIVPATESIQNRRVSMLLIGAAGKRPWVGDRRIQLFKERLRGRIANHE